MVEIIGEPYRCRLLARKNFANTVSYSQCICQIHFSNIGEVNNANSPIFPLPTVYDIRCVMYVGIDGYLGYKLFKDWGV